MISTHFMAPDWTNPMFLIFLTWLFRWSLEQQLQLLQQLCPWLEPCLLLLWNPLPWSSIFQVLVHLLVVVYIFPFLVDQTSCWCKYALICKYFCYGVITLNMIKFVLFFKLLLNPDSKLLMLELELINILYSNQV